MESKQSNTPTARRRERRWSVIDTVILFLVLVAIAGIVYRIVITVTDDGDTGSRCQVYFEVSETHRDVLDDIQGFEEVYLLENDMLLGSIGATSVDPETGKVYTDEGKTNEFKPQAPGTITVTVDATPDQEQWPGWTLHTDENGNKDGVGTITIVSSDSLSVRMLSRS